MFRRSRETIIALRARHQSFRIATEIGRPHLEMPPPPQPAIPVAREKPVLTYCPSASPPQPGYI
jgi:hypothetical protein